MTLDVWQARLHEHFTTLHKERSAARGEKPIFALEHGLNSAEREELANDIRLHLVQFPPVDRHSLAWIVYASEIGYRYVGDEYWQTFEQETPGWTFGHREWLRWAFKWFHTEYGGAEPCGSWAEHFSIICWPITHAILPHDLQHHLARILYEIRHIFSHEVLSSPSDLGRRIAARSWEAPSRFQNLAQDTSLIGQIAAGLLFEGDRGTGSLICPPTLRRIGADLDRERSAREWLKSARRSARDRIVVRGLSRVRSSEPVAPRPALDVARDQVAILGIEPRLVLQPDGEATGTWTVRLEIPDLSRLLTRFPDVRKTFMESRCFVTGSSGRPLPRRQFLYGTHTERFVRWPKPEEPLLRFEQPNPTLDYLLRTECLLRPGPVWLFGLAPDGLGYEIRSLLVRAGQKYIVVSTGEPLKGDSSFDPVSISCEGVHAAKLELLSGRASVAFATELRRLGLKFGGSIRVSPAGLTGVRWDGEGRAEWLSSEHPTIAIFADHDVDDVRLNLVGFDSEGLNAPSLGPRNPLLVQIPQLPVGAHKLRVSTRSALPFGGSEVVAELEILVREPRSWTAGLPFQGPMSVAIDPMPPTLEQLWEGRFTLEIRGPHGREATPIVSLFEKARSSPILQKELDPLQLPVEAGVWAGHFQKQFRDAEDVQNAYDSTFSCILQLVGQELGTYAVFCERALTPVRWLAQRKADFYNVRLIDESDVQIPLHTERYTFEAPDVRIEIENGQLFYRGRVPAGLYVAVRQDSWWAQIVPPLRLTLGQNPTPSVLRYPRTVDSVAALLAVIERWGTARMPGNILGFALRNTVLRHTTQRLLGTLVGSDWEVREEFFNTHLTASGLQCLRDGLKRWGGEDALGEALLNDVTQYAQMSAEQRISELTRLALRFGVLRTGPMSPEWLVEASLRMASEPWTVPKWAGPTLRPGMETLLRINSLSRAARFLSLAIEQLRASHFTDSSDTFSGDRTHEDPVR